MATKYKDSELLQNMVANLDYEYSQLGIRPNYCFGDNGLMKNLTEHVDETVVSEEDKPKKTVLLY